ncbi:MAG: xylulokinase [Candidatus Sumerlaeota bacterium]|nr:xylulokinase [Candidatus Sumerlaeota bacterium]
MAYLLGLDIGTSGTKALLIDAKGRIIASATQEYPLLSPKPGWAEQDPSDWWKATCATTKKVLAQSRVTPADIKGVGLSGQMHGSVFMDKKGGVIRPALLWCDARTVAECAEINKRVGAQRFHQLISNPPLVGFTAPKIVWLKNHEPKKYAQVRHVVLPKDYVRYRLTGEILCEVSDAAGTVLFNVKKRQWCNEVLDALGIPREWMPETRESYDVCGTINAEAARLTGLKVGTPVVGGGADNTCGAIGSGVVVEGRVSASLGTSGVIFAPTNQLRVDKLERVHSFVHSTRHQWYLMGCMISAGMALRWYRDKVAMDEIALAKKEKRDVYDRFTEAASKIPAGAEGLWFLPYLQGERSPLNDPYARGCFIGLTFRHDRAHIVRAIIEGITFGMRSMLEVIKDLGTSVKEIRALGGGAKSPFWRQLMADIFGDEIAILQQEQGGAMGAAILAGVGAGIFGDFKETTDRFVKVARRLEPSKKLHAAYAERYEMFKELYQSLKPSFPDVARMQH